MQTSAPTRHEFGECVRERQTVETVSESILWGDARDKDKAAKVLEALERYCNPRDNEVIESHRFWNIPYQEPFDKFLTELKTRAASCNFQEKNRTMREKIVLTVTGQLQELIPREDSLRLAKAVKSVGLSNSVTDKLKNSEKI